MACMAMALLAGSRAEACTGITLSAKDSSRVVARTIEWGGSDLNSQYVIVPRGYKHQSYTPEGIDGMTFTARYGYVGLAVEQKEFVAEGLNEAGLSAGLFYFPGYGEYEAFDASQKSSSLADLQLVSYVLATCKTVDEVKEALKSIHVVAIDPRASTVHWRFADQAGHQVVLEIIDGRFRFYDNTLGVLTNSPGFEWQLTNLNNYVNLYPGSASSQRLGGRELKSFGAGSGFLGIPGDITPPSRFVRAAFYQATAPVLDTGLQAVLQGFQILIRIPEKSRRSHTLDGKHMQSRTRRVFPRRSAIGISEIGKCLQKTVHADRAHSEFPGKRQSGDGLLMGRKLFQKPHPVNQTIHFLRRQLIHNITIIAIYQNKSSLPEKKK